MIAFSRFFSWPTFQEVRFRVFIFGYSTPLGAADSKYPYAPCGAHTAAPDVVVCGLMLLTSFRKLQNVAPSFEVNVCYQLFSEFMLPAFCSCVLLCCVLGLAAIC